MATGDLWGEIWSRPGSAIFERVVVHIPGPVNFTKRAAGAIGEGSINVPADWERIVDVINRVPGSPSSDIRRLCRIYQEQAVGYSPPIYEFFLDLTDDETDEVDLSVKGPGVESLVSDAAVYPWDWDGQDESTSTWPDWIWGGKDIVGPVLTTFTPHIFDLWTGPGATGTFGLDITHNGDLETATLQPGFSAFQVEQEIEGLTFGLTVDVEGNGTVGSPWHISILGPDATYEIAINSAGLSVERAYFVLLQFGELMPIGWTLSRVGASTVEHGPVTDFRASLGTGTDPPLPGGCSAWIVFDGGEYLTPGVQKIVRVQPGGIYQVTDDMVLLAWGGDAIVRVVIRDLNENFIAAEEVLLLDGVYTNITGLVDVLIPAGITQVVFRIGHIGEGDPPPIFIGCPNLLEGLAPTTAGGIMTQLVADAMSNHVADGRLVWEDLASPGTSYLDLSFTPTLTTDGQPYDDSELTFTAQRGKSYLQVLTDLGHLGYRWSVTPSTTGRWELNLYNPSWLDVDATALPSPAINLGSGVTSGPIYRSHLTGNVVTVEGAQLQFGRVESASSVAAIGRREIYQPDRTLLNSQMATLRAAEEVTSRLLAGLSVAVSVDPVVGPVPFLHYDVDWQLNVQIPPVLAKSAHRVSAITTSIGEITTYKVAFSSEAFSGMTGVMEATRRLMLKFEGLEIPAPTQGDQPILTLGNVSNGALSLFSLPGQAFLESGRLRLYFGGSVSVLGIRTAVHIAPTGAPLIVDINKNGVSVFNDEQGQMPVIPAAGNVSAEVAPVDLEFGPDDYMTVDTVAVGSTIPGGDLTVMVRWVGVA